MKKFPLNDNGKLDKAALPEPDNEEHIIHAQTKIEHQLINIWKKAFRFKKIGVNSHFFELGGHSIIAAKIIIDIEKAFSKRIQLEDIYKAPTIRALAITIKNAARIDHKEIAISNRLKTSAFMPLSDFQFIFWISILFEPKIKNLNIIVRRRMTGKLDAALLTAAFSTILKKHKILHYSISKYFPLIHKKENTNIQVVENDLSTHSADEAESILSLSLDELTNKNLWRKDLPLLEARLFHLENELSELQISVSHMSFDDLSGEILLADLSNVYLHYQTGGQYTLLPHERMQYEDYIFYERSYLNKNLSRDIKFWKQYLHDTSLIVLPEKEVLSDMRDTPYSTYLDLTADVVENAQKACAKASISITNLLCAAVTLALKHSAEPINHNILINIVRAVRENDIHDAMIGCFLRFDPIKVNLKTHLTTIELAKSIQQARIDLEPHQACSGMVKFACLDKSYRKKFIRDAFLRIIAFIYCKLFKKLQLNSNILSMYGRLNSLRTKRQFIISINLLNNFVSPNKDAKLFGLNLEKMDTHKYDLSKFDNVLDICFMKNPTLGSMHLVISGNLNPTYRQQIGEEIIKLIQAF
jgi:acyl carrier protein